MIRILTLCLITLLLCSTLLYGDNDRPITFQQLPTNSQEFILKYFPQDKVAFAKIEKNLFDLKDDVLLVSGVKLEFFKNGDWKEVHCTVSKVPVDVIPDDILNAIKYLYPNRDLEVIDIERSSKGINITLNNGAELKFSPNMKLLNK